MVLRSKNKGSGRKADYNLKIIITITIMTTKFT
jgi:hypothetical protein